MRCQLEKGVVEIYDVTFGAVVGFQGMDFHHLVGIGEFLVDGIQQSPVARAPTIDALLDIAHDEILRLLMTHTFLQQHLEVLPLYGTGVLEFINHDVFQLGAYLLEDKW